MMSLLEDTKILGYLGQKDEKCTLFEEKFSIQRLLCNGNYVVHLCGTCFNSTK